MNRKGKINVRTERAHLFFNWFEELGQLGSRLLKGARVVSQLHGLNTAKLREQLFYNTLKQTAAMAVCKTYSVLLRQGNE